MRSAPVPAGPAVEYAAPAAGPDLSAARYAMDPAPSSAPSSHPLGRASLAAALVASLVALLVALTALAQDGASPPPPTAGPSGEPGAPGVPSAPGGEAGPEDVSPPGARGFLGVPPEFPRSTLSEADLDAIAGRLLALQSAVGSGDEGRILAAFADLPEARRQEVLAKLLEMRPTEFRLEAAVERNIEEIEPGREVVVHAAMTIGSDSPSGQFRFAGIPASLGFRKGEGGEWRLVSTDLDRVIVSPGTVFKWATGACASTVLMGVLYLGLVIWLAVDNARRDWSGRERQQIVWFVLIFAACGVGPLLYLALVKLRRSRSWGDPA